jgi:hypothetical protein
MMTCEGERLKLRAGDTVQVRSKSEIIATLETTGTLDGLPFMPEMVKYCGRQFRVFKRVDKVCDTIDKTGFRRMRNVVILDNLRCDGESHGGCEAECMLLWKEEWLKPTAPRRIETSTVRCDEQSKFNYSMAGKGACVKECIKDACLGTRQSDRTNAVDGEIFMCQATELKRATTSLPRWDPRPHWRVFSSGNLQFFPWITGLLIIIFNAVQRLRNGAVYPHLEQGTLTRTPSEELNLQPGEVVEVKSWAEIMKTLDRNNKNRGLWFDVEMMKFCGRRFKVHSRVRRIINEKTGKMLQLSNSCIILSGVACNGDCHEFCPRSEYIYWREIWLKRVV